MRILILADLHGREDWFRFAEAFPADLTTIAGDLLDGFNPTGILPQAIALARWTRRFPHPLAICSGNHDANMPNCAMEPDAIQSLDASDREEAPALLAAGYWMDTLDGAQIVTDRRSRILQTNSGRIAITTLPFDYGEGTHPRTIESLWKEGYLLRRQYNAPWIVLHHEPPALFSNDHTASFSSGDFAERLEKFQPDFAISGHLHLVPYLASFANRIGKTWSFNPGHPTPLQAIRAKKPNHILLDLNAATAIWTATPPQGTTPLTRTISLSSTH